jgi:ATP-dependent helicase/nuclease subunit A
VRAESLGAFDVERPLLERFLRHWPWPYGAQSNEPLTDAVDSSDAGRGIRAAAAEEHRRVLYVSLTRARDVIVLARSAKKLDGEWMATVALGDRLPTGDAASLPLRDGGTVSFQRRTLSPAEATPNVRMPEGDLRWFNTPHKLTAKLPLTVSPSSLDGVRAKVAATVRIGSRIPVRKGQDPAALGEAVHACLAAQLVTPAQPLLTSDVQGILERTGVAGVVEAGALTAQVHAVTRWLQERWPAAESLVEVPITRLLANGQRVSGRIDLLLRVESAWILVDHKSGGYGSADWNQLAGRYGGQLAAYREAIETVTGVPVNETWLVMPVAGAGVRVEMHSVAGRP